MASCADLHREHIEAFKTWLSTHPTPTHRQTAQPGQHQERADQPALLLHRITEWGYPNPPQRPLIFPGDLPIIDKPLPRFLDDAAAAKLLRAARADPDPLSRLIVELLARTGIRTRRTARPHRRRRRADRLRLLAADPDRQAAQRPLHPAAPTAQRTARRLDHPPPARPDCAPIAFCSNTTGRSASHRVTTALRRVADAAGIGNVTAHQLRHTLATQAINRGMSLDAIAALLGHKTLAMTMIYARIADKTVADEYFAVTEKVEALYDQPRQLPADDEGREMRKLRGEMHRRMLGNGYCARPVEMDCHFESICESCTLLRHHHRVPPHPASANATTPPARAKSAARRSSTASSTDSTPTPPDRRP